MGLTVVCRSEGHAEGHRDLLTRIDRLEADAVIDVDEIDFTMSRSGRVRDQLSDSVRYFAEVEGDVPQNVADVAAFLPRLCDCERRFLTAWSAQESAHSAIFDRLGDELGLEQRPPPKAPAPSVGYRSLGFLARLPWMHDVLKHVYLVRGAMHEHLTHDAYRLFGRQLEELEERGLARSIAEPIRRQEAAHLGYYRLAAALHRKQMSPAQIRLARYISVTTYSPVGAIRKSRLGPCGRTFSTLTGPRMEQVLAPVQAIADGMLGDGPGTLPPFVRRAMIRTMEYAGVEVPATANDADLAELVSV